MRRSMQGMGRVMALAASVAVLPAGAAAQAAEASDQNDRAAHAFATAVDLGEVQQSMLAVERAANPEVRAYAQQMVADHHNAMHTREMLMQTERSGLLDRAAMQSMHAGHGAGGAHAAHGAHGAHGAAAGNDSSRNQGPLPPAYGPGNGGNASGGNVPEGQRVTSSAPASDGTRTGELPPVYGAGNGSVNVEQSSAQGAHAGHGSMAGGQAMGTPMTIPPAVVAQLESVLQAHPMSRPVMASNAQNLQVLQGIAAGPQFDRSYMDAQIGAHQYALNNIDRILRQEGLGEDITGVLRMMRTAVAAHLQTAQQIRGRLGS